MMRIYDCHFPAALFLAAQFSLCLAGLARAEDASSAGAQIYASHCFRCHGEKGAGTEEHPDPLFGTLSVNQLAEQIQETMPEDDPGSLTDDEAAAVAAYVHEEFYSPIAQSRNEPVRIELARLTVNQYRRAIANVVDGYQPASNWKSGGLHGQYYNGRQPGPEDQRVLVRTDPVVDFHFGTELPLPELKDPFAYSMIWSGSVFAPDTGWYDFGVTTEHAVQLWVNHQQEPLVDAWVKSGDDIEHRGKIFLLGGEVYPLRLRFSRGNQGVTDEKVHSEYQTVAPASIQLSWKPPQGAWQTIPARCLSPQGTPANFVCATPFPPDDRSYGWERATTVSQAWFDATTDAAVEVADFIGAHLDQLADTSLQDAERVKKLQDYCAQIAERAFRSPLDEAARTTYVDRHFAEQEDPEVAVRRSVLMILKSPRFLFREVGNGTDAFNTAARLAFALTDAPADEPLRAAARVEELATVEQLRWQADRLLSNPRAKWKLRQFLLAWLQLDGEVDLHKDSEKYPGFDEQAIADLRASLDLFLEDVVWSEGSDYRQLFLADEVFLNQRLASFYGETETPADGFAKERLDAGRRAGVITHPYVLARYAHADVTSPIHRGVFLVRKVLGQALKPPPVAIAPLAVSLHPDLTTRERVTMQTEPASCMTCHHLINPLGFSLERFDAVGRYRETEHDKQIDDSAEYQPREGDAVSFAGARELAEFLAESPEVRRAFIQQMFQFLVQQSLQAYGSELRQELEKAFVESNYNMRELAVEIATRIAPIGRTSVDAD